MPLILSSVVFTPDNSGPFRSDTDVKPEVWLSSQL